jgi:hypothetical protein
VRQHRRLIAAAGTDFESSSRGFVLEKRFDHPGHHVRLRDRLPKPDRQRRVLVGAAGEGLLDEEVARHRRHGGEHALVAHSLIAQPLDHAPARALGSHAHPGGGFHFASHSLAAGNWTL